jgi:hypothetical protein
MSIDPKSWAANFTADLLVSGEHVPLDRVVGRHADAFAELRKLGMTWRGIAGLLVRAGARRSNGNLISSDQLRVSFARLERKKSISRDKPGHTTRTLAPRTANDAPPLVTALPLVQEHRLMPSAEQPESQPQDVSTTEIEAALSRLDKIGKKEPKE